MNSLSLSKKNPLSKKNIKKKEMQNMMDRITKLGKVH